MDEPQAVTVINFVVAVYSCGLISRLISRDTMNISKRIIGVHGFIIARQCGCNVSLYFL